MKQQKITTRLFMIILVVAALYPWFGQAKAQKDEPYAPSGILTSRLGDELPPGQLNVRFPPRDPVQVDKEIRRLLQEPGLTSSQPLAAQAVPAITDEIETLATGLEDDPLAIYDYVHNHVDYIPSWGLLKNPRETLLAGAGNAFDQTALLAALLDAAGFQTRYVWGNIRVSKTEAINWVGANDSDVVGNVFASGGIPTTNEGSTLLLTHIWVEVFDGGTWHSLDPSFKTYSEQAGQDLRSLLGYNLSTFVSDAETGATITSDYVQNLNQSNIQTDLAGYALNLVNYLRSGEPFIYLEELIGGRQIEPIESTDYPSALPYEVVATSGQADDIPDDFAYALTIQLPGINYTVNVDDIAGERITIFYECATSEDCQRLDNGGGVYNVDPAYQVNVVPKLRIGGTVVDTGDAVPLGSWGHQLDITIATPISGWSPSSSQSLIAGEWYALPMRLQAVSNQALARHVDLLNEAMSQDLGPDDEQVLGQILNVLGLSYFNEVGLGDRIDSRLAEVVHVPHFSVMIASRNLTVWVDTGQNPVRLDPASHTVDVRLSIASIISAENPADANRERAWFFTAGMRGSATEHAIIEQLQPISAVSTIQLLKLAIEEGQRIYYVTPDNWNAVYPSFGHSTGILNSIVNDLNGGRHVVIHQNPITYGDWQGAGWISLDPDSGSAGYLISGYLVPATTSMPLVIRGGGGCCPQPPDDSAKLAIPAMTGRTPGQERATGQGSDDSIGVLKDFAKPELDPAEKGASDDPMEQNTVDPIDTTTGSFLYHHVDLFSLGGLGVPLGFERFYASSQHNLASDLGYGWSHTYDTQFYVSTDWVQGFGARTALEAAPVLAAAQVALDLFDPATVPHQRFAMGVTAAQWLMSQITGNAATLSEPDGNISAYVRLVDGIYQPPVGRPNLSNVSSTGDGGVILDWENGRHSHFDAQGRLTALDDASDNRTILTYDGQGRLVQASDAGGRHLTFNYDAQDRLSQMTDPYDRVFNYSYDSQGNLQTYTDPRGGATNYAYDADHRLTAVTDPGGITYVANQYDALGRVAVQTNGGGGQTDLLYGGDHTIVTDPMDYRTSYFYDEQNRLLSIKDALGHRRSAAYDAAGHEVVRTNGLGQTITYAYDAWGHATTTTDPLGHTTTWAYDTAGNPTSYINQRGKTWQFAYDGRRNLTSITSPLGEQTTYTYNTKGQLTQARNGAGVSASYSYDVYGNLTSIANASGESRWSYDVVGRPTSFTDGTNHTMQFGYDALDNLLQVTDPLGHLTAYTCDANGNLVGITDANGHTTTFAYDVQFNLTSLTDTLGRVTSYDYDANDNLVSITDANGHETTYQRDLVGQLVAITDPLERTVAFTYDAADRLTAFDRADGSRIGYQRDDLGRLTGIDYPTGPDIAYNYDAAGNLIHAAYDSNWSASYSYDDAERLSIVEDESRNLTVGYEFDAADRRTRIQVKRDTAVLYDVAYDYNTASRLSALTDQTHGAVGATRFDYDAAGRVTRTTDPGGAYTDHTYDAAGRVAAMNHQDGQGSDIATYVYTYDAVGNLTTVNETTPVGSFATDYGYDALDQLTEEIYSRYTIEYSYDPAGNMASRTDSLGTLLLAYDDADQLQSRGSESFGYDPHGNLTTWQNDSGLYTYGYDYESLLTDLALPGGDTLNFTRDAFGRRLAIQGPAGTQSFLYDGLDILLEGDSDLSQTTAHYLYGNSSLAARYTDQLGFTTYLGDALANVRYLLNSSGQPSAAYHYEAYGLSAQPAGIDPNPYRFDGRYGVRWVDAPGGALLMGYRDYDPLSGRFLTRDPLAGNQFWSQTLNDYGFALRNPVRYHDRTGLRKEREGAGLGEDDSVQSSIEADGGVLLDSQFTLLPSYNQPKQRAVSPTRVESIPAEMTGWPESKYNGRSRSSSSTSASIRWLPVAFHGSTYALTCTADDHLLAGAFHTGMFRSLDEGHVTWSKVYTASVSEIVAVDANTYYAGTWYDGVLKSSNGGDSWTLINDDLDANHIYALAVDPVTPTHIFAGTEMGLFVSDDGGASWDRPAGTVPGRSVSDLALIGDALLVVTDLGLYRSVDNGNSWLTPTVDLSTIRINALIVGSISGTVYAGTGLGLYQSIDSGDTWTSTWSTGLEDADVYALAIDPSDANHMAAGTTGGLFVSVDGGATWTADANEGLDDSASQVGALAFCPDGGDANLYLGVGGGVYALRDPTSLSSVTVTGPITGVVGTHYIFTATAGPISATVPIDYVWQATGQSDVANRGDLTSIVTFKWDTDGDQIVTVTVDNGVGVSVVSTHTINISDNILPSPGDKIYLPFIAKRWPPVPDTPTLNPIYNADRDGNYSVTWNAADLASTYTLQEDDNSRFSSPVTRYTGSTTSWTASNKSAGTYYYQVKATNSWGDSGWSGVQTANVHPPPTFYPIADASVLQGAPTLNDGSDSTMWVGYDHCDEVKIGRGLVEFDLSAIPAGTQISQATLYLYLVGSCDLDNRTHTVTTYRINADWSESTVNWNNKPGIAEAYGSAAVASRTWTRRAFDVTSLVRGWVNGSFSNYGVMLRGPESSGNSSARLDFATSDTSGTSYDPYLSITYTGKKTLREVMPVVEGAVNPLGCGMMVKDTSQVLSGGMGRDMCEFVEKNACSSIGPGEHFIR